MDIRTKSKVTELNPNKKYVVVDFGGEKYELNYDKLILSPGAQPVIPSIRGLETQKNTFTLRNIPDLDKIMHSLDQGVKKIAVIGAGFIGLEVVENLVNRGITVELIEQSEHVSPNLDAEMAVTLKNELIKHGVIVKTGLALTEVRRSQLVLSDESSLEADDIVLAVGVKPDTNFISAAGVDVNRRGSILVNRIFQTSQKDVYAVGDAISVNQQLSGEKEAIALAGPANRQGREVADVLHGLPIKNRPEIGTAIVRVFDKVAASTGLPETIAKFLYPNYHVIHTLTPSHAGYYPNATPIHVKVIFDDQGTIIGAQAAGKDGVDKRIDIMATAIKSGMTVYDLPELELTYAPPFGAAKDPIHMAGYASENILLGLSENIQYYELNDHIEANAFLLDVREPEEVKQTGYIEQSVNIPLDSLRERLNDLPRDREIIIYCKSGQRSYIGERILRNNGFKKVKNLDGAFSLYSSMYADHIKKD